MKFAKEMLQLYLVTDRKWLNGRTLGEQVEEAIQNGVTFVQLREKSCDSTEFLTIAQEVKAVCARYDVPFVINDNIEVALAVAADGVHIGQSDEELSSARRRLGRDKIIGVSVGNIDEARQAQCGGADYVGVGAIFSTDTKHDALALNPSKLAEISRSIDIPTVAIGGISEDNVGQLTDSGIVGIAVVSAILAQPDIGAAARRLQQAVALLNK